jgi:phospholipase D1/2
MVMMPEVPAFPGPIKDTYTIKIIMGAQWRTINRGGASIVVCVILLYLFIPRL